MHTHTRSTDIIDHSIHELVMEIIEHAHIYSGNVPGVRSVSLLEEYLRGCPRQLPTVIKQLRESVVVDKKEFL
jgi:hypothetical protein